MRFADELNAEKHRVRERGREARHGPPAPGAVDSSVCLGALKDWMKGERILSSV